MTASERSTAVARLRASVRGTERDVLRMLGSELGYPLEIDDDGSEYLRTSPDTTLDVRAEHHELDFPIVLIVWHWMGGEHAEMSAAALRQLISERLGWHIMLEK
jgi:hypothetical protein